MAYCTDSFGRGLSHTFRLLFQPIRLGFWIKMIFLVFCIQGFSVINLNSVFQKISEAPDAASMMEYIQEALPVILSMVIGSLLLGIFMEFLRALGHVVSYDAVWKGTCTLHRSISEQGERIVILFLWNLCIKLGFLFFLFISAFVISMLGIWLVETVQHIAATISAITIIILYVMFLLFLYILYVILFYSFVIPQMVVKSKGLFESWQGSFRILVDNPGECIGYTLIRMVVFAIKFMLVIIIFIMIGLFMYGFQGMNTMLLEPETAEMSFFQFSHLFIQLGIILLLLPIPILKNAYALSFLSHVLQNQDYEPLGDQREKISEEDDKPPQNELPSHDQPVSFHEIPSENPPPPPPPPGEPPGEG